MLDPTCMSDAVRYERGISRRLFLACGAALSGLPTLARSAAATAASAPRGAAFQSNPFALGVASGDPDASSVVLWTRLAPRPLEPDGGMTPEAVEVRWELAEDEAFRAGLRSGRTFATPQLGHSVHVEALGLQADRWYFYRFHAGDATSAVGRTRTLPAAEVEPDRLRFAFASCQHYEQGLYTAYEQMARDDLDLVFHLGDYIYENPGSAAKVRKHTGPKSSKLKTLADYRERHAQYRADPLLQAMHAACPWFVTWDDHEFDNNYAGAVSEKKGVDPAEFLIQRAAAYQAYYEMMPLRARSLPRGPSMRLYRTAHFGRLAEFFILDTRQYRTDQPNDDGLKPLNDEALRPTNSLLGRAQRGWLDAGLIASTARWNVLAQQVMMAMVGFSRDEGEPRFSMDQWPGAAHERMELMKFLADRKVPNPVVLTGDIHSNWVNNLRVDDREPRSPLVATEFVGTSISSGGNGSFDPGLISTLQTGNPGVQFFSRERGYVRCVVTPERWTSDYVAVEDVTRPGGKVVNRRSFAVEAGQPGAHTA